MVLTSKIQFQIFLKLNTDPSNGSKNIFADHQDEDRVTLNNVQLTTEETPNQRDPDYWLRSTEAPKIMSGRTFIHMNCVFMIRVGPTEQPIKKALHTIVRQD